MRGLSQPASDHVPTSKTICFITWQWIVESVRGQPPNPSEAADTCCAERHISVDATRDLVFPFFSFKGPAIKMTAPE
jgi:hypothetical protein